MSERLIALCALSLLALACSKDEPPADGPDTGVATAARVKGRLRMKLKMRLPNAKGEYLESQRAKLTEFGVTLAPDYSEAAFDSTPIGWPVKLGDTLTFVQSDGTFAGEPSAGATEWTLFDPTAEPYPSGVWFKGKIADLVADDKEPPITEIPVRFRGGCGMDGPEPADQAAVCGAVAAPTPKSLELPGAGHGCGHHAAAPAGHEVAHHVPPVPADTLMSSYPPLDQKACRDKNGFAAGALIAGGFDLNKDARFVAYLGSTCHGFVLRGCCVSEGGTVAEFLGVSSLPDRSCPEIHHGRQCQELSLGDLVLTPATREFEVGTLEEVPIAVHNNGCFGYTTITLTNRRDALGGTMVGPHLDGVRLKHWESPGSTDYFNMTYKADRDVTYRPPRCVPQAQRFKVDQFEFAVDGTILSRVFRLKQTNLYRFTSGVSEGMVFSADRVTISGPEPGCPGQQHVHQLNPCTLAMDDPAPDGCGHGAVVPVTP